MTEEKSLTRADLIELYDSEIVYVANPDVESYTHFSRILVTNLLFSIEAVDLLYLRFEQVEDVITEIWYRGGFQIIKTTPRTG
jgi:hypothetical protein